MAINYPYPGLLANQLSQNNSFNNCEDLMGFNNFYYKLIRQAPDMYIQESPQYIAPGHPKQERKLNNFEWLDKRVNEMRIKL